MASNTRLNPVREIIAGRYFYSPLKVKLDEKYFCCRGTIEIP